MKKFMMEKNNTSQQLAETDPSVVMTKWGTEAIAERNALQKRLKELEAENKYLRGVADHGFGPEHGKVCIARYVFEQAFKIPKRAVSYYVKWGTLHWMGEDQVWHEFI